MNIDANHLDGNQTTPHARSARQAPEPDTQPDPDIRMYWDLPDDDLARLRSDDRILEDEGYLAHDLLWGRRLLDLRHPYVPIPDVDREWEAPECSERFSDAIAAILQVAVQAGFDPDDICTDALSTREGAESYSRSAARSRQ